MSDTRGRPRSPAGPEFEDLFAAADGIPGWLTRGQARVLYDAARALQAGSTVVEIGSHQGRSTVVLAGSRPDIEVVSIDPFVGGKYGGEHTARIFERHLREAGVRDRVRSVPTPSEELRVGWTGPVDLLYVDGAHDPAHAYDDLSWSRTMVPGSRVLVHDAFSSVGVTLAILWLVVRRLPLRYAGREGSLATFVVGRPTARAQARMLGELPWFVRNVGIKVLLRLRLHPLARLAGHRGPDDPY